MHIKMQKNINSRPTHNFYMLCTYRDAWYDNALQKETQKKTTPMRDKSLLPRSLGNQEPNALIPSCHAPGFVTRDARGLGELIRY